MFRFLSCSTLVMAVLGIGLPATAVGQESSPPLRIGIIGLDTSHVIAFTKVLNDPKAKGDLAGVRVVAAFPGGSPDVPDSRNRLAKFTQEIHDKYGVEIVDSIDALLKKVDVVLLESVDGRPHLEQVKPVIKARKPVFIDKPVAGSLADAIQIYQLAREANVPCFSSSSLRFNPALVELRKNPKLGDVLGCDTYGPCSLEEHHPDLFWYGIHGVETLFTIMGTGCESVARVHTKDTDLVTGIWKNGRVGTFRGIRGGKAGYGAVVFGSKEIIPLSGSGGYEPLLVEICRFFKTGKPPVTAEQTLEIFAFMEATDESKRQGGIPVTLASVMAKARRAISQPRVPATGRTGEVNTPPARGERQRDRLKVGDPAPDFTLPDSAGKKEVTLSNFRGKKPVVLIFGSYT
jgi:predicted dehydrogenase